MYKLGFWVFLVFFSLTTRGQTRGEFILFEILYKDHFVDEEITTGYCLLNIDSLCRAKTENIVINNPPTTLYNLTKLGGIYIANNTLDQQAFACWKYGQMSKAYLLSDSDKLEIHKKNIKDISIRDEIKHRKGFHFIIQNAHQNKYIISCWKVSAEYCLNTFGISSPTQPIFCRERGYLLSFKPNGYISTKIKVCIKNLIKEISF
jgi:hypothetical protein